MKESIASKFVLDEVSGYGDVFTLGQFVGAVKKNVFTDDDGYGQLIYQEKQVKNSSTYCDEMDFKIGGGLYPMVDLKRIFGKDLKVIWFNR